MICSNCSKNMTVGDVFCADCGTKITGSPHHLLPGTTLNNKYLVGQAIGEGGFGITYIGRDTVLDCLVAIKEYYPNQFCARNNTTSAEVIITTISNNTDNKSFSFEKYKERFLDEARTLAKFERDACIVNVKDFFEANNTAYIIMEYVDGHTLKEHLEAHGAFSVDEFLAMMHPLMLSLSKVHEAGLIHRDISPDNIKITADGDLKLLDFGAARYFDTEKTVTSMIKAGYAPEEQYRSNGQLGPWTDIYSLCATIYKCITGVTPDDSPQRLHNKMHGNSDLKMPSEFGITIDPRIEEVILYGMSVTQNNRYQNISELINAIDSVRTISQRISKQSHSEIEMSPPNPKPTERTQYEDYTELLTEESPIHSIGKSAIERVNTSKKRVAIISVAVAAVIIVLAVVGILMVFGNGNGYTADEQNGDDTLAPYTATPEPIPTTLEPTPTPEPTPEPEHIPPATLDEVIFGTTYWVRINVFWVNGEFTVFERDRDAVVWTMRSRQGFYRIVEPLFFMNPQGLLSIGFPTTSRAYILNNDFTGSFGTETMTWNFETDSTFSRNSRNNLFISHDLADTLARNPLIIIRIYFRDQSYMILYSGSDGVWRVRGRDGTSFARRELVFRNEEENVIVRLQNAAHEYILLSDGTGVYGYEWFTWYYGYSDG